MEFYVPHIKLRNPTKGEQNVLTEIEMYFHPRISKQDYCLRCTLGETKIMPAGPQLPKWPYLLLYIEIFFSKSINFLRIP